MKNKTNRKIKKRRTLKTKKNFGGMKKNENGLDGKAWETPQGYNCVSCMDQKTRNASMKTMCSKGHGICIKCVKDFCKGRARPEWREQGPNRVKCPLCGEDITDRCMEITGKNTLEKMAEMHNVPTFAELHAPPPPPSPAPSIESPIHYPTFGEVSPLHDGGPMVVEELDYEVNHGGKKRRKRRNTKKKRRGGGNELSQESINKDLKDMRTSLQQTFVPTGPREHRSKSNLDAITLGNFKIQDKEEKRVSKKKSKRKK